MLCGRHFLAAKLRPSNIDGAADAVEEVARIVDQMRESWPGTRIVLRADSGFAREPWMAWCEANEVDYLFGLAKNARLAGATETELAHAGAHGRHTGRVCPIGCVRGAMGGICFPASAR